jgi:molecular chaperone GrpE
VPTQENHVTQNDHPTWPGPPGTDVAEDEPVAPAEDAGAEDDLARITAERDEYLDQLQRSRAEFLNFKRRNDQERAQLRQFVTRDVLAQFLPVIDDFQRALDTLPEEERESDWVKGVNMIQDKLTTTAQRLGAERIDALGQPFDPALHEAVATEPGSTGTTIVEVYQNGYRIGDVLVRPAMVKTGDPLPDDDAAQFDA